MPKTQAQKSAYMKQWRAKNIVQQKEKHHAAYMKNRDGILAKMKEFRDANPDIARAIYIRRLPYMRSYHWRKKYGVEATHIQQLLNEQNNSCAICHEPFQLNRAKPFHVDHCHSTNRVRGLLCFSCNQGIGSLKDSVERARSAADYLERSLRTM